jgi:2-methylisocitrate lyase-like PEP mutase family enzyme
MLLTDEDQHRRGVTFRDLHTGEDTFVVANAWDAGSARLLSQLGFAALATTSAGLAYSLGRPDGANLVDRDEAVGNARAIVAATRLPVTADLESCYAESSDGIAETIRLAAAAGLVGGSIEDATGDPAAPIQPLETAAARVAAAVEAARSLPFPFTLTARAENFLYGVTDLQDTIRRLRAYQEAGADVLYAPCLPDAEAIRAVCAAVDRPVNVVVAGNAALSVTDLAACGVRRISLGSAFARASLSGLLAAAREVKEKGTFSFTADAMAYADANAWMSGEVRE